MTEAEWLAATDPVRMLAFLGESGWWGKRKGRLFGCACARRAWRLLRDERSRHAVVATEAYADGLVTVAELETAWAAAQDAADAAGRWDLAARAACYAAAPVPLRSGRVFTPCWAAADAIARLPSAGEAATPGGSDVLRDIFGPLPFRPLPLFPAYNAMTVQRVAQAAYDERQVPSGHLDPVRLAVLCDALLDAGCPVDAEVLQHLRGPGPHWRGCWALDTLLGRG
jgi:hypothetical protein